MQRLRSQASQLPRINTERFKNCYFNRIRFKDNLAIQQYRYPMFYRVYMIIVNDLCDFHAIDLYTSLSVTFVMNFNARYKYVYSSSYYYYISVNSVCHC